MAATLLLVEHRWGQLDVRDQRDEQVPDAGVNVREDAPQSGVVLAFGVLRRPVDVLCLARTRRTRRNPGMATSVEVAASHAPVAVDGGPAARQCIDVDASKSWDTAHDASSVRPSSEGEPGSAE